jgi:hypothetical protein
MISVPIILYIYTRVGQNRIYTPYMTACMVISLPKIPYVHRTHVKINGSGPPYVYMVLANPEHVCIWSKQPKWLELQGGMRKASRDEWFVGLARIVCGVTHHQ